MNVIFDAMEKLPGMFISRKQLLYSDMPCENITDYNDVDNSTMLTRSRKRKQTHVVRNTDMNKPLPLVELQITFPLNVPKPHVKSMKTQSCLQNSFIKLQPNCASCETGILSPISAPEMMDLKLVNAESLELTQMPVVTNTEVQRMPVDIVDFQTHHQDNQAKSHQVEQYTELESLSYDTHIDTTNFENDPDYCPPKKSRCRTSSSSRLSSCSSGTGTIDMNTMASMEIRLKEESPPRRRSTSGYRNDIGMLY